jgi:predicted CxxxxCH...CXXCH cytochrome family protein
MKNTIVLAAVLLGLALLAPSCSELQSDIPAPSPSPGIHPEGWSGFNPAATSTHGKYLAAKDWDDGECKSCHGGSYAGGTSGVSCFTCHDAYPHSVQFSAGSGHPGYLQGKLYPLNDCKTCHGSAYQGGSVVNVSCMSSGCHVDRNGAAKSPEACNTCHGDFRAPASDQLSYAPPRSVAGDTATAVAGVGAHQRHLKTGTTGKTVKCAECHTVPTAWNAPGHIDPDMRAEVVFNDTLARLTTGDGTLKPAPTYNRISLTCANVYCHGDWRLRKATSSSQFIYTDSVIVGNNRSPKWTGGNGEATCGTCHGIAPTGHQPFGQAGCYSCHTGVIDANGNIVDKSKHVDGRIEVFGTEVPFR